MYLSSLTNTPLKRLRDFGVFSCMVGLVFSKAILSLSIVLLILTALFANDKKTRWNKHIHSKSIVFFILFYLFLCLSICWSNDKQTGVDQIIINLPLLLIPIALFTLPGYSKSTLKIISIVFVGLVVLSTCLNFIHYQFFLPLQTDIRSLSWSISHIRLSLFVCFSIFILIIYFPSTNKHIFTVIALIWLFFYAYYSQVLSGVLCFITAGVFYLIHSLTTHKNKRSKLILSSILLVIISFITFSLIYFINSNNQNIKPLKNIPTHTRLGNPYSHNHASHTYENGYPLDMFVCEKELDSVWNLRSKLNLDDRTSSDFRIRTVLIRYLTSRGLPKDAYGVNHLSKQDIVNIENGIASVLELQQGLKARLTSLSYELASKNPNGHSMLQRLEYWKTGISIFKQYPLIGTGIGDYKHIYQLEYIRQKSILEPQNRLESHNQFLGILVVTGIIGFALFVLHIIFTFFTFWKNQQKLPILFYIICFTSFLVEDTLTTLTGMCFYSLFMGLFLNEFQDET
jgi:hypothetical protein